MRISANRLVWLLGAWIVGSAAWASQASAQSYPSHNITAIIPFAAGNANDITARIVLEQVGKQMGQAIIIDNRGGAGGTIGVGQAARATPDGYTILFHSASFHTVVEPRPLRIMMVSSNNCRCGLSVLPGGISQT